jgi:very-short-patch-repair endonuclease
MSRDFARHLRKNMTDSERRLWHALRYRQVSGHKFRRQAPIGPYIADFVCFEKKVILELDGGQHSEQAEADAKRTQWLNREGFTVLRFWNHQVFEDLDSVLEVIWRSVEETLPPPPQGEKDSPPTPSLPHKGGGSR